METRDLGLVHLYWGEGKGKTTAAMGLALRALGHGRKVTVVQFLKNGSSGELAPLRALGAAVYAGKTGTKFASQMTPEERAQERANQDACLARALEAPCDLVLLDEAFSKMDQERSAVCLKYARQMDLQLIVCVPDERLQSLIRNVDCVYGFRRHKNQISMMHIDKGNYLELLEGVE